MDDYVDITLSQIDICRVISYVSHESCGAVATFLGIYFFLNFYTFNLQVLYINFIGFSRADIHESPSDYSIIGKLCFCLIVYFSFNLLIESRKLR